PSGRLPSGSGPGPPAPPAGVAAASTAATMGRADRIHFLPFMFHLLSPDRPMRSTEATIEVCGCSAPTERLQPAYTDKMDIRILGPLEVEHDAHRVVLGPKLQTLLAILLVHRGATVSIDRIVEELYGGRPPRNAAKTLQVHV